MSQAITTKYLGPTNQKGARVKAAAEAGSTTISWDHGLDTLANHSAAAEKLARKLGWSGRFRSGSTEDGYVFILGDAVIFEV